MGASQLMCWRGHDAKYRRRNTNGQAYCKKCHLLIMRSLRHPGYPVKLRPLYRIDAGLARKAKNRLGMPRRIIAQLSGISVWFFDDLMTKGHCTTKSKAAAISDTLKCRFEDLWRLKTIPDTGSSKPS